MSQSHWIRRKLARRSWQAISPARLQRGSMSYLALGILALVALLTLVAVDARLLAQSAAQEVDALTLTRPPYKYDWDPNGDICGTTGPSPNIVSMDFDSANSGRKIEVEIRKCDDGDFGRDGRVELMVNNDREWRKSYSSGVSVVRFDIDPVAEKNLIGVNRYITHVYSDDQSTIAKHTGEVLAWEKYDTPPDVQTDLEYRVSPTGAVCDDDIIQLRLIPNHAAHNVTAEISKCNHGLSKLSDTIPSSARIETYVDDQGEDVHVLHFSMSPQVMTHFLQDDAMLSELQRAEANGEFFSDARASFGTDDGVIRDMDLTARFPVEGQMLEFTIKTVYEFGVPVTIPELR